MKYKKQKLTYAILLTIFLSACQAPPPVKNVADDVGALKIPNKYIYDSRAKNIEKTEEWWRNFQNPNLNALMDKALKNNGDINAAALNWQKTRLAIKSAEINEGFSFSGSQNSSASRNFKANQNSTNFGLSLSARYQVDLWNKLEIATQNAVWAAQASEQDLLALQLSLQGDLVRSWLLLIYSNEKLDFNQKQLNYQQKTLDLVQSKYKLGKATQLEVLNAKQVLENLKNSRNNLLAEQKQAQMNLTTLLGEAPSLYAEKTRIKDIKIPEIPKTLPAENLKNRPDLRASQLKLQRLLGNIAIAERNFYPDINLTASLGTGGSLLRQILQNPVASVAAAISLPFLEQRENEISLAEARLEYKAALESFKQDLWESFKDVENALIALIEIDENLKATSQRLKNAQKVEELTRFRYNAGKDTLLNYLDAQQSRRNIEEEFLTNRYERLRRMVNLYLAIGS